MIGDHEKVEGTHQLDRLAGVGDDFLSAGAANSLFNSERGTHQPRVNRQVGVEVGVTKVHVVRIGAANVGRVDPFVVRRVSTSRGIFLLEVVWRSKAVTAASVTAVARAGLKILISGFPQVFMASAGP